MDKEPSLQSPAHDWHTISMASAGMDEEKLAKALQCLRDGTYPNVHSLLILKEGKIACEAYLSGHAWNYDRQRYRGEFIDFSVDSLHNLASVTKSVTSILIGIAIDRGFIPGVDEKIMRYFPEYVPPEPLVDTINLHHLLTMTSGLKWNEEELPYSDQKNDLIRLFRVKNPLRFILSKPLVDAPGARFSYNSGGTNILGEILRRATGMRMDDFAKITLFEPLDIRQARWEFLNPELVFASGNLHLRARDLAKLGQLFLNGGMWNGQRVVSQAWIEASTRRHSSPSEEIGYGYHWWIEEYRLGSLQVEAYSAVGWGGQRLIVIPGLDLVVVLTGGNYVDEDRIDEFLTRCILPAMDL